MFGLGGWEIGMLLIFGLLFFGPKKLPQLMKQAGKVMREVRKASSEFQFSIERELDDDQYRRQHRREKKRAKILAEKQAKEGGAAPVAEENGTGANGHGEPPVDAPVATAANPTTDPDPKPPTT